VAAFYGMSVKPEARGRGIAAGLTTTLVRAARDSEHARVVLHSTAKAVGVYRRAGFVERCVFTIFATRPLWSGGRPRRTSRPVTRDDGRPRLTRRPATRDDIPALVPLMRAAIEELQKAYLDEAQIESSHAIMGLDHELIDDGTYFVVECDGQLAGCGGWSRRATLYGGDHSAGRDSALLDPARNPARIRAMYTHPAFTRRGVGRLILSLCESAAAAEGFTRLELMSTLAGAPLYSAAGFEPIEEVEDASGGAAVPLIRMGKRIAR
jgi:GNAT superfamily N-acetyltransferase